MIAETDVPLQWRAVCGKCSRFVSMDSVGTIYTPWGPSLEYDGYTDICTCSRCGQQEVHWTPTKWGQP